MENINMSDLRKLEVFKNLKDETIVKLCKLGVNRKYKKGEHIYRDKELLNTIYIINSGKVAMYKLSESAQKKIVFILDKEKILNAISLDNLPSSINAEAFEESEILCINRKQFIEAMKEDFELCKIVIDSMAIKVRRLYRQSKNSIPIKIEKRLAAKLWKLSKDYGVEVENGTLIDLNITVTYLADMFGTPRETISRALKILSTKDLIINKNKRIIVKDRQKLSEFFKGI